MTYNVHQLLHLKSDVENLGPLWTHSCFFFEDLNGDFRDLSHGTQNVNGQVHVIMIKSKFCCGDLHVNAIYNCTYTAYRLINFPSTFWVRFYILLLLTAI